MQQCREGWHLDTEPEFDPPDASDEDDDGRGDELDGEGTRPVRSTRRRQDVPDLPRVRSRTGPWGGCSPRGRQALPALDVRHIDAGLVWAGHHGGRPGETRRPTTTGEQRWMRCTSRSWWTGSGRTCGAARATRCSTSRPSRRSGVWHRICIWRSGGRSPERCCVRRGSCRAGGVRPRGYTMGTRAVSDGRGLTGRSADDDRALDLDVDPARTEVRRHGQALAVASDDAEVAAGSIRHGPRIGSDEGDVIGYESVRAAERSSRSSERCKPAANTSRSGQSSRSATTVTLNWPA
jgi:hypothetical protein